MGCDADTMDVSVDYREDWQEEPDAEFCKNPYRYGWERFIRHMAGDESFHADISAGIRNVPLSNPCLGSAQERRWVEMGTRGLECSTQI